MGRWLPMWGILLLHPLPVGSALAFKPAIDCTGAVCVIEKADVAKLRLWVEAVFQHIEMLDERDARQAELIGQMRQEISRFGAGCRSRSS